MVCVFGPAAQQICLFCAIWHQTQQTAECLLLPWCSIKKEFIAALRASEHYISFLSSVLLLLPNLHFFFSPSWGVYIKKKISHRQLSDKSSERLITGPNGQGEWAENTIVPAYPSGSLASPSFPVT